MRLCIIGTGYVGLVTAACFAEMGNSVKCVDINPAIVAKLEQGEMTIFEPGLDEIVIRNHKAKRLAFTTSLAEGLEDAEIAFICVGTPSSTDGSADLQYVEQVAGQLGQLITKPLVVVDKSTVPVGTAQRVRQTIQQELDKRGLELEFHVVSNPEFLKEGDAVSDFMKPDRVVLGTDSKACANLMRELYAPFARSRDKMLVMSIPSAEMTKYAANCMLATKISFINEIARICEEVGADAREVRNGIGADHRIGYHFIYPGVGYGGSCFPKDVKALIRIARQNGIQAELLEAVDNVNARQKLHMANKIKNYFADQGGLQGKTLALWGLAFKANTDDIRQAAALEIIPFLTEAGMNIQAYDPVAGENAAEAFRQNPRFKLMEDEYAACAGADALLLITEWNQFRNPDFDRIKSLLSAPLIFDGRNLYNPQQVAGKGFAYFCVGRQNG